jgi:hypothetical protein
MGKQVTGKIGSYDSTIEWVGQRVWEGGASKRVYMETRAVRGHGLGVSIYKVLAGNPSAGDVKVETEAGDLYVKGLSSLSGSKAYAVKEIITELFA